MINCISHVQSKYEQNHTLYITLLFTSRSEEKCLPTTVIAFFYFAFEIEIEDILS